jgi:hypothetical protein
MSKRLAATAIFVIAVLSVWLLHRADLIIHGETPVFEAMPGGSEPKHQIALLHSGQKFTIDACIDDKSYYGYEIKFRNGRTGYVLKGNTEITQKSFLLPPYSQPIVWNCF